MQPSPPLLSRPATELAQLVRSGQLSASELLEASLKQAEAQSSLGAFTWLDPEAALASALPIAPGDPRPFAGVPMAIKELTPVAGQPWTLGSRLFAQHQAPQDAYSVRRLRQAGFVLMGRTASPEFGLVPITEPSYGQPCRNPWNPQFSPGGSSGGAAAAVAAGVLPVAHGSDGGGSIRIPAACCGLVGLKPSRGRISAGPFVGDNFLSTQGVLSRNVADSAHLLDILAGYEVGDTTWAPPPTQSFASSTLIPPHPLRIAFLTHPPTPTAVNEWAVQATQKAAGLLESLGHHVQEAQPPGWTHPKAAEFFRVLWSVGAAQTLVWGGNLRGQAATAQDVEALTWHLAQEGLQVPALVYAGALDWLKNYTRTLMPFFQDFDVLLTPALAQRPPQIGAINPNHPNPNFTFEQGIALTPFTPLWNVTGQPAISLPLFVAPDGLPLAVQAVGGPLQDGLLLSLAAQLEQAVGWNQPLP